MEGVRLRAGNSYPEKTSCAHTIPLCPGPVYKRPFAGQALWAKVGGGRYLQRDQRVTLTV